ncbi:MAG: murein biosynthesis integral membrane protein MurJ [Desulfotomaculaceae bacterium]|nr:murein biosynthesis integral membrane protein MurJ [Desulfotomaculaceae bacterium]MDD4767008.1 murein biosynthesis integral membrane protein MurJ [Desulfotomaculaceae bacterium]
MTNGKFIFKATLMIAFFSLMSKVLGLTRESVIASMLSTSYLADAYQMAIKAPNMLFTIISGALATVIVPVFTEYVSRGEKREAWKLFNTVMALVIFFFLFASVIGIMGAPLLVKLVAPGYSGLTRDLTVELLRVILPWMVFASLASLYTQLLNANNIFGLPAFSSSVNNVFIIIFALTLGKLYGVQGLTLGTMLAMAAMALVQFPALYRAGFRINWRLDLRHPGLRKIWDLALPSLFSLSVTQANVFVTFVLASWLPVGSVSSLGYADKLIQFSIGLLVTALATAVFPTISRLAAEGDMKSFAGTLLASLKFVFAGIIAASVGLMILSHPIVNLVYGWGAFDQKAVEMTTAPLIFYAVGTVGFAAGYLLTRGFYSLQDTRTPLKISIVQVLINLGLSLLLIGPLRHAGLALASSLANLAYMIILMWYLGKKVPGLYQGGLLKFILSILAAAGLMAAVCYMVSAALAGLAPGKIGLIIQIGAAGIAGLGVFVAAVFAMRLEEAHLLWRFLRKTLAERRA